jgi:hypothetical protein
MDVERAEPRIKVEPANDVALLTPSVLMPSHARSPGRFRPEDASLVTSRRDVTDRSAHEREGITCCGRSAGQEMSYMLARQLRIWGSAPGKNGGLQLIRQ